MGIEYALATFYNGVFLHVILPDERTAGSCIRTGLQRGRQLAHPHRFTTSRPIHLFAPTADSAVTDFSFTGVIINSAVDNFWPDISGEIHPVYFYYVLLSLKEQLLRLAKLSNAGP